MAVRFGCLILLFDFFPSVSVWVMVDTYVYMASQPPLYLELSTNTSPNSYK